MRQLLRRLEVVQCPLRPAIERHRRGVAGGEDFFQPEVGQDFGALTDDGLELFGHRGVCVGCGGCVCVCVCV